MTKKSAWDTTRKTMKWRTVPCPKCAGTGKKNDKTCRNCLGRGKSRDTIVIKTLVVPERHKLYGQRFYEVVNTISPEDGGKEYRFL